MKNKFFAVLGLILALTVVSCDNTDEPSINSSNIETAKLGISLSNDNSSTGKTVNRGNLHAWIDDVNITARSTEFNYSISELFNLTDEGDVFANTSGVFTLDKVALGKNDITVTTTCSTNPSLYGFNTPDSPVNIMSLFEGPAYGPYAIYSASINGYDVKKSNPVTAIPNTQLTTNHGRVIATFELDQQLKSMGLLARVTTSPVVSTVPTEVIMVPTITVDSSNNGLVYWSNESSVNGASITFNIELFKIVNGQLTPFVPVSRSTATIVVVASKSVNKRFTIHENGLTNNAVEQTFTAQPWIHETTPVDLEGEMN